MWPGLDRCATIGFRCVIDASTIPADITRDCQVDIADLMILASQWLHTN